MATGARTKYHVAINSKGFNLYATPQSPRYTKEEAPSLVSQLGIGDVAYNQLTGSGWSHWAQSDWSGGFQNLKWKDDASFKDGQAIEVLDKYGQITLQNNFISALSISGSHSYGAHGVHGSDFLLGTVKSGGAKLFKITTGNSISTLSAMVGISAVNSISRFGNISLVGLTRTSGTLKTLAKYNGTSLSAFRSTNPIVRSVKGIGIRAYISEYNAGLSGDIFSYATNLSAFTSAYQAGKSRKIPKIENFSGTPYFFIEEGDKVELMRWDEYAEEAISIYTWNNLTNWGVTNYLAYLVITGKSNGKFVAFSFNGAQLKQIFEDQLQDSTYDFSKPFEFKSNVHTKGAQFDGAYWFPGLYGKYATVQYTPFANFNNKAYAYAITGSLLKVANLDTSKYAISGNVVSSEFGSSIGAVDKLINTCSINCKALATGQTIEVFRSTDGGSSFTSIGKAQYGTDGAVLTKKCYFPSGFTTKLWNYKAVLCGPGTSTPTLHDISFEYRPYPDTKKRWSLTIDAGENVKLLNTQDEERDAKNLLSELWLEKETKRTVIYEDVDSFNVNIISAMSSAATSARVKNTRLMPYKGRMRVWKNNVAEEMIYTSADGGAIKGITRARKGTLARAYTSADTIDNFYNVVISDIAEQINNTDQNKTESIARVVLLEV